MAEKKEEKSIKKTVRGKRSPNYPGINIEKAISMILNLYEKFQRHAVPAPLAMEAMGYSIKSGKAQSMLASLSYYDLVHVERGPLETKKVNVSSLGFNILKNPDEEEKSQAIYQAALKPMIFRKLLVKFPEGLPNNRLLAWELENNYDFNVRAIPDFITIFKQTMDYAKVYEMGIMEEEKETLENQKIDEKEDTMTQSTQEATTLHLNPAAKTAYVTGTEKEIANYPIKGGTIRLLSSGPVTQKAIDKLIALLTLSKDDFPNEETTDCLTGDEGLNQES